MIFDQLLRFQYCAGWSSAATVTVSLPSPLQDAEVSQIQVQVCIFAFDLLYLNGEVCMCEHRFYVLRGCGLRVCDGKAQCMHSSIQ